MELNHWETETLKSLASGLAVDFRSERNDFLAGKGPEPSIRGDILLKAGLADGHSCESDSSLCVRWDFRAVTIEHVLDLRDGRQSGGGPLPAIRFKDCIFRRGFQADNSHLSLLSFEGCSFGDSAEIAEDTCLISLRGARIDGDLNMKALSSMHAKEYLWIDATAIRVGANLVLENVKLSLPPAPLGATSGEIRYALKLRNAVIGANLYLEPAVWVQGGIHLDSSDIHGTVAAEGLIVTDGEDDKSRSELANRKQEVRSAIRLQSAQLGGHLLMRGVDGRAFQARGAVHLYGLQLAGSLDLSGAQLEVDRSIAPAIALTNATIKGDLLSDKTTSIKGDVAAHGCTIEGDLRLLGAVDNIDAGRLTVGGDSIVSVRAKGNISFGGANVKGQFNIEDFSFSQEKPDADSRTLTFSLEDADIGHSLYLATRGVEENEIKFIKGKWTKLLCYPGYRLAEIELNRRDEHGWAAFLWKPTSRALLLDGASTHFRRLGEGRALDLHSHENVKEYLRLYCAYVWGDKGAFAIVETDEQLPPAWVKKKDDSPSPTISEIQVDAHFEDQQWQWLTKEIGIQDPRDREKLRDFFTRWAFTACAWVRYGAKLYKSHFVIAKSARQFSRRLQFLREARHFSSSGLLRVVSYLSTRTPMMFHDEELADLHEEQVPKYKFGLWDGNTPEDTDFFSASPWQQFSSELALTVQIPHWRKTLQERVISFQNAHVNLADASCSTLEDADGRAWGSAGSLSLENFTFARIGAKQPRHTVLTRKGRILRYVLRDRIPSWLTIGLFKNLWLTTSSRATVKDRLAWLHLGSYHDVFLPQPYAHLAKAFREQGDDDAAKHIEEEKIHLEVNERAKRSILGKFRKPLWQLYRLGFRYGLSAPRAVLTMLMFLVLGWAGVSVANRIGVLVVEPAPVASVLVKSSGSDTTTIPYSSPSADTPDVTCGDRINNFLYAVDVFIPLLDLKQAARCDIRAPRGTDVSPRQVFEQGSTGLRRRFTATLKSLVKWPITWEVLKLIYAVLGWLVISLAILTFSGTLRRWDQELR